MTDDVKAQPVRVLDVVLIGPLMIWGGVRAGGPLGALLGMFGVGTIAYNAINYLEVQRRQAVDT